MLRSGGRRSSRCCWLRSARPPQNTTSAPPRWPAMSCPPCQGVRRARNISRSPTQPRRRPGQLVQVGPTRRRRSAPRFYRYCLCRPLAWLAGRQCGATQFQPKMVPQRAAPQGGVLPSTQHGGLAGRSLAPRRRRPILSSTLTPSSIRGALSSGTTSVDSAPTATATTIRFGDGSFGSFSHRCRAPASRVLYNSRRWQRPRRTR